MSLPWVRLDTGMPRNHKILALIEAPKGKESAFVYVCSLSYCGEQGLEGFLPKAALPFIHAKLADAQRLVDVGLWVPQPGGWMVNGWTDYQPSDEQNRKRSQRARDAAAARWEKVKNGDSSNAPGNASSIAKGMLGSQSTDGRTDGRTDAHPHLNAVEGFKYGETSAADVTYITRGFANEHQI